MTNILRLAHTSAADLRHVGGKHASLGEMISRLSDETVVSPAAAAVLHRFVLHEGGDVLLTGRAIGQRIVEAWLRLTASTEATGAPAHASAAIVHGTMA